MKEMFSGMTEEEKSEYMGEMMMNMMQQMFGGEGKMPSMMDMMRKMMSGKSEAEGERMSMLPRALDFKPWELCQKMAKFGFEDFPEDLPIPEGMCPWGLYGDWVKKMDEEILKLIKESKITNPIEVAQKLNLSEKGAIFFITKLAREGKLKIISVETTKPTELKA
ncbi:MAG: hypothetical protein H3Z53_08320 [archaeon]|nr:hypothetical protein [archaeon]